jgi:hypothetical protein
MDDDELMAEFMRLVTGHDMTVLEVALIEWAGPYESALRWRTYRRWKRVPSDARVAAAKVKALECSRYFDNCETCGRRFNAGHMLGPGMCQGCAETELGVVY